MDEWRDWQTGQPKHLGDLWTLRKVGREAACVLVGHPLGVELRVSVGGELQRSQAFKDGVDAIALADEWRAAFEAKGWRPRP